MERVELRAGLKVWLVSAASVSMIATAHQVVAETLFEKKLPQQLVTFEVLDTPVALDRIAPDGFRELVFGKIVDFGRFWRASGRSRPARCL